MDFRSRIAAVGFCLPLLLATPKTVLAVDDPPARDSSPEALFDEATLTIFSAFKLLLCSNLYYEALETLDNGNIIICRHQAPAVAARSVPDLARIIHGAD